MEVVTNARKIMQLADRISTLLSDVERLAREKAATETNYKRSVAIKIEELRQGGRPLSGIEKVAEGECSEEGLAMRLAETAYKARIVKIEGAKAIMNGLQSVNRHLDSQ